MKVSYEYFNPKSIIDFRRSPDHFKDHVTLFYKKKALESLYLNSAACPSPVRALPVELVTEIGQGAS